MRRGDLLIPFVRFEAICALSVDKRHGYEQRQAPSVGLPEAARSTCGIALRVGQAGDRLLCGQRCGRREREVAHL